jgi:hypothetical protein
MAPAIEQTRPFWGVRTTALGRVDVGRARLDPSLAVQRARGLDVRPAPAPAPAPFRPLPERVDLPVLMACLEPVVYGRGTRYQDLRPTVHAYALLVLLRRQASAPRKGRRPKDATVRRSIRKLVAMMAPACGWNVHEESWAARERHQSSVRRWLALLVDAGLLACAGVVDELFQDRATDFTLLAAPVPPEEAVATARRRLARWRKRYGHELERSRVAGPVLAYLAATREAIDAERGRGGHGPRRRRRPAGKRPRRGPQNTFGTRPKGLSPLGKGNCLLPPGEEQLLGPEQPKASVDASAGGRETDLGETRLDGFPNSTLAAALNALSSSFASREEGEAARWETLNGWQTARLAAGTAFWTARIAESEATCHRHVPTPSDPLPALPVLRLAAAGRAYGVDGMADDPTIPGMSERHRRRLRAAAARWLRYASPEFCGPAPADARALPPVAGAAAIVPSPASELLRLAGELGPDVRTLWPTLVAQFVARSKAARGFALDRGDAGRRRDAARARDAERHRAALLHYWPEWIQRHGDEFVTAGHTRFFVQVHRMPDRATLESDALRRWLRAVTALMWGVVPTSIEFSDPDGRNVEVPVDLAKARHRGERTRGVDAWQAPRGRRRRGR